MGWVELSTIEFLLCYISQLVILIITFSFLRVIFLVEYNKSVFTPSYHTELKDVMQVISEV